MLVAPRFSHREPSMSDRPPAFAKLLPLLTTHGSLAEAMATTWDQAASALDGKLGLTAAQREAFRDDCLRAIADWAATLAHGKERRAALSAWLLRLRQELSLEELIAVLLRLDRALRQAVWQLGLSAPDWLAMNELLSRFFEAVFEEAAAGWQGLAAQNRQLRDELAYFHRLASSLDAGQDLTEHLQLAVRETARLLHCEFCAILLPKSGSRDVLAIRAAVAPRILSNALEGMSFPLAENGLIAQVFLTGAPASTYSPLEDLEITMRRRQTLESLGFSQLMAYPLQTHGRVLGVLCVANRLDDQPWQALEEEWLSTVAGQLSASIRLSQSQARHEASEVDLARALASAVAMVDPALRAHGAIVGDWARRIGATLGLAGTRLETLELAGLLHDLGMLAVPDAIRLKPGPLWSTELAVVRKHPMAAVAALAPLKPLEVLLPAVRHHHERWDGQGYPEGLRGQDIPLDARIVAVADAYTAMVTPSPYREAVSHDAALAELQACAGTQFDPLVVQALAETFRQGEAPVPVAAPAPAPAPSAAREVPGAALLLAEAPRLVGLLNALANAPSATDFYDTFWDALSANVEVAASALWRPRVSGGMGCDVTTGWRSDRPEAALGGPAWENSLEAYVAACRVPVAVADVASETRFIVPAVVADEGFTSAMALPLSAGDRVLGVLTVYRRASSPFGAAEQTALELAAAMLAQGLQGLDQRAYHQDLLHQDALTGLANHRAFAERLDAEIRRAMRFDLPISVVRLDLDGFGAYVEANGYGLGDEALKLVADLLRDEKRAADLIARLDADGFAWLLPECGASEAMAIAEQLRLRVSAGLFPGRRAGGARLTASVAVTTQQGVHANRSGISADLAEGLAKARAQGGNTLLFHASAVSEPV
jgi:diguanylate cyclase (GGDEF)-like protein